MIKRFWKDTLVCRCNKCHHVWLPQTTTPYLCPQCKTAKWNDKRLLMDNEEVLKRASKKNITRQVKQIVNSEGVEEVLTNEDKMIALDCASKKGFECSTYYEMNNPEVERVVLPYKYCVACKDMDFNALRDILKPLSPEPIAEKPVNDDKETLRQLAINCPLRVTENNISNCNHFNRYLDGIKPPKKECYLCVELEEIWKHLAVKAKVR